MSQVSPSRATLACALIFINEAYEYNKTKKYLYRSSLGILFLSFSTPLCVSGLGTLTLFCALLFCRKEGGRIRVSRCCPGSSQTHHLCLVACQIAFTLLLAPLLSSELMPCALTPAYGVTSICRFVQAVTALSIVPTVDRSSPLLSLGLLAVLFGLLSF